MEPAVFFLSSTKDGCTMSVPKRMMIWMVGATGGVLSRPIMTGTRREDIVSQRVVNGFFLLSLTDLINNCMKSSVIYVGGAVVLWSMLNG